MKNKSLRFKLLLLSSFLIMIAVAVGGVSSWSSSKTVEQYNTVAKVNLPNTRLIYEVMMQSRQARIFAFQLALPGLSRTRAQELLKELPGIWEKYEKAKKDYLAVPFVPGEQEVWDKLIKPLDAIKTDIDKIVELYQKNPDDNSAERKEMIKIITVDMDQKNTDARAAGTVMRKFQSDLAERDIAQAEATAKHGMLLSFIIIFTGIVVGLLFSILFSNQLIKTLTTIAASLTESGIQVGAGSTQIASASQELSQATTEQAASLEETAASIEEMNQVIAKNTDNAERSLHTAKISQDSAIKGKETVEQMIKSIDDINQANMGIMSQVDHSNAQMQEIVRVITEIGNKTKVINDIVFQTKLLSFNASVEAARAGEHGKGFAVVAEEVGNLAAMSGNAAHEITGMLEESIRKVESIVEESKSGVSKMVDEGKKKVDEGTSIAKRCGEVLQEIVENIEKVAHMNEEISKASMEQSQGMAEITKAMHSLDQVTQQNSAASEQSASAAEELSAQAGSLNNIVADLAYTVTGKKQSLGSDTHRSVRRASVHHDKPAAKVLPLKVKNKKSNSEYHASVKKASGDGSPSYNDSRFTDI